jgi:hypothetical protein
MLVLVVLGDDDSFCDEATTNRLCDVLRSLLCLALVFVRVIAFL